MEQSAFGPAGATSSVTATIVRAIASVLRERGHDPNPLLERAGIEPSVLSDVRARVSAIATVRMWDEAPRVLGDPDFGLSLGENPGDALGLAGYLLRASSTFGEGLVALGTYYRVFNDVHPMTLEHPDDRTVSLVVRTKHLPLPAPRHAVEFAFAWMVSIARKVTGHELVPTTVRFEHAAPESSANHERIFRCRVEFDADASELRFPVAWLALPHTTVDPHLRDILVLEAQAELNGLPSRSTYGLRVRELVRPQLKDTEPTLEAVAARLHMSARTLQRYLKDEGTTFQREIDELRRSVAEHLLREQKSSLAEIAHELGFADQSAFHKAFVRWTGRTPGDFRRG